MDDLDDPTAGILFWLAAQLVIESESLHAEAVRCEARNLPWARNRRRRAGRLLAAARSLCGGRALPWGVKAELP